MPLGTEKKSSRALLHLFQARGVEIKEARDEAAVRSGGYIRGYDSVTVDDKIHVYGGICVVIRHLVGIVSNALSPVFRQVEPLTLLYLIIIADHAVEEIGRAHV